MELWGIVLDPTGVPTMINLDDCEPSQLTVKSGYPVIVGKQVSTLYFGGDSLPYIMTSKKVFHGDSSISVYELERSTVKDRIMRTICSILSEQQ